MQITPLALSSWNMASLSPGATPSAPAENGVKIPAANASELRLAKLLLVIFPHLSLKLLAVFVRRYKSTFFSSQMQQHLISK